MSMVPRGSGGDNNGSGAGAFAAGMIFGALIGCGLALLFAPDAGEQTRRQLQRRVKKLRVEATEGLDKATDRTRRELARRRRRIEAGVDRAASRAREVLD